MVSSFAGNLSSWMWPANSSNAVTAGSASGDNAPVFTEEVKKNDIVKEGVLYKQSRYLKQWKK